METLVIDRKDFKKNIKLIKKLANKSGKDDFGDKVKIITVVKQDGYGLGLIQYAKFLIDNGFDFLAVETVEDAIKLRESGINCEILILSSISIKEEIEKLIENNIIISIDSKEIAKTVDEIAIKLNKKARVHLKIDIDKNDNGYTYTRKEEIIVSIKGLKNIIIEGTFSKIYFKEFNEKNIRIQFERFIDCIETLKMNDIDTGILHICDYVTFVKCPNMHLNAVRIEDAFLGRVPFKDEIGLKEIAYLKSNISEIRELSKVYNKEKNNKNQKYKKFAIIPIKNVDEEYMKIVNKNIFKRIDKIYYVIIKIKNIFNKKIFVKINGKECEVLGRVDKNNIVADITNVDVKTNNEAIFKVNPILVENSVKRIFI